MTEPTLANKYAKAVEDIAALQKQLDGVTAKASQLDAVTAERDQLKETNAKLTADHAAAIQDLQAKLAAKDADIVAISAERDQLKGKLAMSPAHIDIAGRDPLKDASAGGSGDAEAMTPARAKAEYAKITDPVSQRDFRVKYAKELGIAV